MWKKYEATFRLSFWCQGGTTTLVFQNRAHGPVQINKTPLSCDVTTYFLLYLAEADGYSSLQEAGVRLIPRDTCRKPEVYGNHVTADMICAGLNGCVDACQVIIKSSITMWMFMM